MTDKNRHANPPVAVDETSHGYPSAGANRFADGIHYLLDVVHDALEIVQVFPHNIVDVHGRRIIAYDQAHADHAIGSDHGIDIAVVELGPADVRKTGEIELTRREVDYLPVSVGFF